jgi:TolB-like protein
MSPQPAPTADGAASPARPKSRRILWIAALAIVAAAAAGAVWYSYIPPIETVIVRPFADGTGQPWLAGAITEEIVEALRPVTMAGGNPKLTAVLDGTLARSGDRLRVTATLSRPDGHRYWTRTFDRAAPDLAVDIAASIVPRVRKNRRHNPPARAYEQYLEARQQFGARIFAQAAAGFERVVEFDPGFGLAWAALALAREHLADQGAGRPNDLLPGARDAAERAVTLEPDLADPHTALGVVKLQYDWDWDGARRELDRALEISPGDPLALRWRGRWLEAIKGAPAPIVDLTAVPRDPDSARRLLAEAEDLREQRYIPAAVLVLAATVAKDTEGVFRWLEAAYDERSVQLPYLLRNPALPLSDPRIVALVRRLKLPDNP